LTPSPDKPPNSQKLHNTIFDPNLSYHFFPPSIPRQTLSHDQGMYFLVLRKIFFAGKAQKSELFIQWQFFPSQFIQESDKRMFHKFSE
jgi:hypothetical protein